MPEPASPGLIQSSAPYFIYFACMACVGLLVGVLGPTLPDLAAQCAVSLPAVSLVLALRPAGYLAGALLSSRLFDRFPGHPVLALSALALALLSAAVPWIPSLYFLSALILVLGLAQGVLDVGSNTLLIWKSGPKGAPYLNALHFCFGLGAFVSPLVASLALQFWGRSSLGYVLLGVMILPLSLVMARSPSPAQSQPKDRRVGAIYWPKAFPLLIMFVLYGGTEAGFGAWLYSYCLKLGLAEVKEAAFLTSLFWACLALGRLLVIPLSKAGRVPIILSSGVGLALASLALLLAWPQPGWPLALKVTFFGLGMAPFFPMLVSLAGPRMSVDGRVSGKTTSLFFVGGSSGSVILPWLMGQAFEPWGPAAALSFGLAALLGILVLGFWIGVFKAGLTRTAA